MKPLPIVAFVIAAAIGWLVAGNPVRPVKTPSTKSAATARDDRPERLIRKTRGPEGVAGQRLAAIRASRDPAARMRATVDLASTLSPSEFADWLDGGWFAVSGVELTLFTKIIEERWANEDPEGFLVWAQKNGSGHANEILATWAKTDPRRVLEFFKNHPQDTWEMQYLGDVAKTDPALALQRFKELAASMDSSNLQYYVGSVLGVLAEKSPAELEAMLGSLPNNARSQVETALIRQRMKGSFDEEFLKLQDRPDGIKLMTQILSGNIPQKDLEAYQKSILADLAHLPPSWISGIANSSYGFVGSNAEQWINADLEGLGFTADQSKRIRSNALGNLYDKPELALKLMSRVPMEDGGRQNLLGNIFRNLDGDADKAEKLIAMLDSDQDRALARGLLQSKDGNGNPKIDNPSEWLAGLAALDPNSGGVGYSYISASQGWDAGKMLELSRQFNALPDDSKRSVAKNLVEQGYSDRSPLEPEAIRFLIQNPDPAAEETNPNNPSDTPEAKNIQLASRYVGKLAGTDPTAAGQWISTLPEGEPKLWAQKNLHTLWSQYDPAAAEEWFGTLPAATRDSVGKLDKR